MGFGESIKTCYSKYADFSGRARRSEYWWFSLYFGLVYVLLFIPGFLGAISGDGTLGVLVALPILWALAHIVPTISVAVRRLHDTDKSGWFYLLALVPFGGIVLLVFFVMDSTPGPNQYGPNPKQVGGPAYQPPAGQSWGAGGYGEYQQPGQWGQPQQPQQPQQWGQPQHQPQYQPQPQQPGQWGQQPSQQPDGGGYPPPPV